MNSHHTVLSRKYRPKSLDDLAGQEVISQSLRSCLVSKKVPHAFLFHGMRGVGKTTSARILARCLSCIGIDGTTNITVDPCGTCRSCVALDQGQHMDIMEFDAASRTGVDDIREIIDGAQYMPVLGRYKIFIIDEVHMLSKSAFNALLKTLEEPPPHVKFIFATTELRKIPETILSRCMTFQLKPIAKAALARHIQSIAQKEGFTLDDEAAAIVSEESDGSARDALSILEQTMMLASDTQTIAADVVLSMLGRARESDITELLTLVLDGKTKDALQFADGLINNGDSFSIFKSLQTALYKKIVDKVGGAAMPYQLSNLLYLWQILLRQTENMRTSSMPEHVLAAAIIIAAHTATFPNIESLMIKDNNDTDATPRASVAEAQQNDRADKLINDILTEFPGSSAFEVD